MTNKLIAPAAQSYFGVSGAVVFGILVTLAFGAFAWSISRRFRAISRGKSENRFDHAFTRSWRTVQYAFLQFRMFKDPYAGIMHILIFFGFVLLTVRTGALMVEGFVPGFEIFTGRFGHACNFAKDLVELSVLLGVAMAGCRRAFARPKRLDPTFDAWFILFLIGLLIVADLMTDASRLALSPSSGGWWFPVAGTLAGVLSRFGDQSLHSMFTLFWWAHLIDILFFANYLPYSKHFHVITAIPNIFAQKLSPMGQLPSIDLENADKFGAADVEDFTWKALFDGYACTECGRCRDVCPTALTGKPLDPKTFMVAFREALHAETSRLLSGRDGQPVGGDSQGAQAVAAKRLIGGWISEEAIWACTMCGYCTSACPVFIIPAVDKIVEMRRHLVLERGEFPTEMQTAFRGMETNGNPWGIGAASRADWAKELPVVTMAKAGKGNVEYLFWVGCAGSYDDRAKSVSKALVEILEHAGVTFAILGTEETCTGDSARRMGNEYLFQTLARQNIETLNGYGVKKIVTNCPHCLNCLKHEYPQLGGNYEVVHGSELVADLLEEGRVKLEGAVASSVTLHDPCYLGRYNRVYDSPRRILNGIPGVKLREMTRSREKGLCCGAGGGRMWMEERLGSRINQARMKEIAEMGVEKAVVACPFCMTTLAGAKEDIAAGPPAFDVLELARAAMVSRSEMRA